jgi:hypothetical protein
VAKVFQPHPHFHPRTYADFRVEPTGPQSARISLRDCAALQEGDDDSCFAGLGGEAHPALDAIAGAVEPHARCHAVASPDDARLAWDVVIDPDSEPQEEPPELKLARISRGADWQFE